MAHVKSHTGSISVIPWHLPRNPRLVKWDVALLFVVVLSLAFLTARAYIAPATRLVDAIGQDHAVNVPVPPALLIVPATVPELISALNDTAPSARINAAQALDALHALGATDALIAATYDSNAQVREEAATALGDVGTSQALARLQELQITSGNSYIQIAAFEARSKITKDVAAALKVPLSSMQALAVAQDGTTFAAASNEFYALRDGDWEHLSHLPDTPNTISANIDGQTLFMSTNSSGLYRSQDGGRIWEQMQFGIQTPTQLTVTSVVVNPGNTTQVYIALSANDSNDQPNSLGIASSTDGGKTWEILPDSPAWAITSQLVLDRQTPEYLYGQSDVGPWRYALLPEAADSN